MKRAHLTLCLFFLAGIPAIGQDTTATTATLEPVRVEGTTFTYKVALHQGLFKKYGLDIQSGAGSKDDMAARLVKGDLDIEDGGLENGVAISLTGLDVVIITGADEQVQELIAQPEIKSIEDLRGKTIVVDTTNQQAALIIKKMLLLHGLKYDADYKFKIVGAKRLPAMEASKDNAAAILAGTLVGLAESKGFVSLGKSSDTCGPLLYHGAFARRDWAKAHADLLARYIAAEIEAQRWILSPANKAKVEDMLMKSSEPGTTPDIVKATYTEMVSGPGAMTPDLRFDIPALKNFLNLRAETEGSWGGTPPPAKSLYDLSYYQKALTLVPKN